MHLFFLHYSHLCLIRQINLYEAFQPLDSQSTKDFLERTYYADGYHPSLFGHQLIASAVAFNILDIQVHPKSALLKDLLPRSDHLPPAKIVSPALAQLYAERTTSNKHHRVDLTDAYSVAAVTFDSVGFPITC